MREEGVVLENGVDAALVRRKRVETHAVHPDFAGGGLLETGDEAQKRGFSGAAFAQESEEFAGSDLQGNAFQNIARTKALGDIADFEQSPTGSRCGSGLRERRAGRGGGH